MTPDRSNGYEEFAAEFIARRSTSPVGVAEVRAWAADLTRGTAILDLGCGHGIPISQALIDAGFVLHGIDASPTLVAAFRERFPDVPVACEAVEDSTFFGKQFDGVVAWGLVFLLAPAAQALLIGKVARALKRGRLFLFTSPEPACSWQDILTGRKSLSLGSEEYRRIMAERGLLLIDEGRDEGDNHYYFAKKR